MSSPPPAKKSNRDLFIAGGVVGAIALLMCCVVGAVLVWAGVSDDPESDSSVDSSASAGQLDQDDVDDFAAAGRGVAAHPGVGYTGTVADNSGSSQTVTLQVTHEGSVSGTITSGGHNVEVLQVGGETFIKAGRAYWDDAGIDPNNVADYATQWVVVDPDEEFGLDFAQLLGCAALSGKIRDGADVDLLTRGEKTTIDGVEVRPYTVNGITYHVTEKEPRRVVRIESAPVPGQVVGGDYRFDLTPLTTAQVDALYAGIQRRIAKLGTAVNSQISFSLNGTITLNPCTTNGCTANLSIANRASGSGTPAQVTAVVSIRMTLDSRTVGGCTQVKTMAPNGSVSVTCRVNYYIPPSYNPTTHQVRAYARAYARAFSGTQVKKFADDLRAAQRDNPGR